MHWLMIFFVSRGYKRERGESVGLVGGEERRKRVHVLPKKLQALATRVRSFGLLKLTKVQSREPDNQLLEIEKNETKAIKYYLEAACKSWKR